MGRVYRYRVLLLLGLALGIFGFAPKEQKYRDELRPLMQGLFVSVQQVLPFYVDRLSFQDPKNAKQIQELLGAIEKKAEVIEAKTVGYDEEMRAYGSTFQDDARGAAHSFKRGAHGQSLYYLEEMLEGCFSCHASREAEGDSKFADLTGQVDWSKVDEFIKPRFYTISRQFDEALKEYEDLILKRGVSLAEVLHFDPFMNYLVLAVRVKGDKARALKTLEAALKKGYPRVLESDLTTWRDSLAQLIKEDKEPASIKRAEALIARGKSQMEYPRDQSGIVNYIEASRVLKELLVTVQEPVTDRANVAYLLGLTELVVGSPFLGMEAQRYFETVIRLQPKTALAQRAFDLYEEHLLFGYSGSSGIHLPANEKTKLESLRKKAY